MEMQEALEAIVMTEFPPACVYLVHPHFPTGFRAEDFGERLAALVDKASNFSIAKLKLC